MRSYGGVVLAMAVMVSCWRDVPARAPVGNSMPVAARPASEGGYWCEISDGGFKYTRFPCAIRQMGAQLVLAKMGGSVRFRGVIHGDVERGFRFSGEMFCPWGDCTQALHGVFRPAQGSTFGAMLVGRFSDSQMVVRLWRAQDSEFGGAEYGGDAYGGFGNGNIYGGLGGSSYGGAVYGGQFYGNP
jgi:hypothetical protein